MLFPLSFLFAGSSAFLHFCRTRFGVFPETGFPGDKMFPDFVQAMGSEETEEEEVENVGCPELGVDASRSSSDSNGTSEVRDQKYSIIVHPSKS